MRTRLSSSAGIVASAAALFLLSGCQPTLETLDPKVTSPVATVSVPADSGPTTEPEILETKNALLSFEEAASASCERATLEGVTETEVGGNFVAIMVSAAEAIEGYSAAYYAPDTNEYGLIFETDFFDVCSAHVTFGLAVDAGVAASITAEQNPDGSFFVVQDLGDFGVISQTYVLEDGFFVEVASSIDDYQTITEIKYGKPRPDHLAILQSAFSEFFG